MTIVLVMVTLSPQRTDAAVPVAIMEVIRAGVKKVIKAIDLKIQRQQNKVVWLQNAQKTLENALSKLHLDEITDWMDRQRNLYRDYFDELWRVKATITYYQRIRDITGMQLQMVEEYKRAWHLFQQDSNFSSDELLFMGEVYTGMMEQSVKNLEQIELVIHAFSTQMSDAKRLEIINTAAQEVETNINDLRLFNRENTLLSLQRAREKGDIDRVRKLYGITD